MRNDDKTHRMLSGILAALLLVVIWMAVVPTAIRLYWAILAIPKIASPDRW